MGEAIVGRVGTEAKKTTSQRAQLLNQLSLIIGNNSEVLGAYFANPKEVWFSQILGRGRSENMGEPIVGLVGARVASIPKDAN